jgi:arginyl-tRNA synthetase
MPNLWLKLKEEIATKVGVDVNNVEYPKQADLSVPCFKMGNPVEEARKLERKLQGKIKFIREIKATGPFLNFFVDWGKFGGELLKSVKKDYGSGKEKGKIMVEFAHPNTHKGFHIGHVRNICIGESLSRIMEWQGNKIIRTNYQGDVGPHISKVLWGLENLEMKPPSGTIEKAKWLGKVYAAANTKIKEDGKEGEIKKMTANMYEGKLNKKTLKLWKDTREWSLKYFDSVYKDFGVKYDRLYFESELTDLGREFSLKLLEKKIAKKSEGAIIVDLSKQDLGVVVLITKDNYVLYNAKELGLAKLEFKEFNPDRLIHVVAVPQTLFFKQLFELEKHIDPSWSKRGFHLSYEMVDLKGEKMASRLGNVILYDELIERIVEKLKERAKEKKTNDKNIKKIAMAALKYGMLKFDNNRKILFDWEAALQVTGNTGPYLQYSYARACSIGEKGGKGKIGKLENEKEIELLKLLAKFPEAVERAGRELQPHYLATYLHNLAEGFNSYYQTVKVIGSKNEKAKLALVEKVKMVLGIGLGLLGIDVLEKM